MGKRCAAEDFNDKLRGGWIIVALLGILMMNSAGDGLQLLVILNLLRIKVLLGGKKELRWG